MATGTLELRSGLVFLNGDSKISNATTPHVSRLLKALEDIHFNYAWVLAVLYVVVYGFYSYSLLDPSATQFEPTLTGPGGKPLPKTAKKSKKEHAKKKIEEQDFGFNKKLVFVCILAGIVLSFVGQGVSIIVHALTADPIENAPGPKGNWGWWCGEPMATYICGSAFLYMIFITLVIDQTPSPNIAHLTPWVLSFVAEVVMLGTTLALYTSPHEELNVLPWGSKEVLQKPNKWEIMEIVFDTVRVVLFTLLLGLYTVFSVELSHKNKNKRREESLQEASAHEATPLLINGRANSYVNDCGSPNLSVEHPANGHVETVHSARSSQNGFDVEVNGHVRAENDVSGRSSSLSEEGDPAFYKNKDVPSKSWAEYIKGFSLFFPYVWPANSFKMQMIVLSCVGLTMLQRAVNVLVPRQIGKVSEALYDNYGHQGLPWGKILVLIALKCLQGGSGVLGATRSALWIPIQQYSYQALTTASFEHVHNLSMDFHLGKRTGEVTSALSKGTAITTFFEQILFEVSPMMLDLIIAVAWFGIAWDAYYAIIVGAITFSYIYITIRMAQWRTKHRREMTNLSRESDAMKNDSLSANETVKYFNAEQWEFERYRNSVDAFQKVECKVNLSLAILNVSQMFVFSLGLLVTIFICAFQITYDGRDVGDFMVLLSYMAQLQAPLLFFGTFYRAAQQAMINGERLLELFKERPTILDAPDAVPLQTCEGEIRFQNVKFHYDKRKPALTDLSFTCRPGTTTALVGESGGGKSTVFRLLFRFYNSKDGSIQIDGKDVKGLTIDSLRQHIGVVPQDTVLFNESVMYNLRYANQNATDEEIFEACRAASIHEKILAFADGYDTKVGERGTKLSGGEKQRVAIARTILKNSRIVMLDEATAALDSTTEQEIQESFRALSRGRTTLVIAHRLSTIIGADQILVLHAGEVAERGTHLELLELGGRYHDMWTRQVKAERASLQADLLTARAKALMDSPGSSDRHGSPPNPMNDGSASEDMTSESDTDHKRHRRSKPKNGTADVFNDADSTAAGTQVDADDALEDDTSEAVGVPGSNAMADHKRSPDNITTKDDSTPSAGTDHGRKSTQP